MLKSSGPLQGSPTSRLTGLLVRNARVAIGWSQRELARRAGVPQTAISRLERGLRCGLDLERLDRIVAALGGRLHITLEAPFLADRARQRELVHARCIGFTIRHLIGHGWLADSEVEILGARGPGWIDVLAFHPASGVLLIIEIKTELHDFGRIQRTLDWYERRARSSALERGWRVRRTIAAVLFLATEAVDDGLRDNRELAGQAFPLRAPDLRSIVADPRWARAPTARGLALIDPLSRRREWLRPARIDGRRARAPHPDYASVARRMHPSALPAERDRRRAS